MKTICLVIVGFVMGLGLTAAFAGPPAQHAVNVPAQPLQQALNDFARQTGLQLVIRDEDVDKSLRSPALNGMFTVEEGLQRLLVNSGLQFGFLNERTVAVRGTKTSAAFGTPAADVLEMEALRGLRLAQEGEDKNKGMEKTQETVSSDSAKAETENETKLEEIVVTAQKRKERLQDVPISITALTGKTLDENRIIGLQDLATQVPGLSFFQNAPGISAPIIRGIGVQFGNSPTTGVYLDDVPMTISGDTSTTPDISTQDLQRVEVYPQRLRIRRNEVA